MLQKPSDKDGEAKKEKKKSQLTDSPALPSPDVSQFLKCQIKRQR